MSSSYTPYPQSSDQGGYGQPYSQGYLQGGPAGFGEAISQAFKNTFTFSGRASRSAYWWFSLFLFIIGIVVGVILGVTSASQAMQYVFDVLVFVAGLALQVRRLHDIDRSGYWAFIGFIPIAGAIVLLVFACQPGTPGPNKFG